jgi:hypothetical protein
LKWRGFSRAAQRLEWFAASAAEGTQAAEEYIPSGAKARSLLSMSVGAAEAAPFQSNAFLVWYF